jgi:hypothetical protein
MRFHLEDKSFLSLTSSMVWTSIKPAIASTISGFCECLSESSVTLSRNRLMICRRFDQYSSLAMMSGGKVKNLLLDDSDRYYRES